MDGKILPQFDLRRVVGLQYLSLHLRKMERGWTPGIWVAVHNPINIGFHMCSAESAMKKITEEVHHLEMVKKWLAGGHFRPDKDLHSRRDLNKRVVPSQWGPDVTSHTRMRYDDQVIGLVYDHHRKHKWDDKTDFLLHSPLISEVEKMCRQDLYLYEMGGWMPTMPWNEICGI